jgi:hypothetical protein
MSPWKRADKAFGFGFFVGVASFYQGNRNNTDFSSSGQMLFAGCCGLFVGLIAYLAAVAYYAAQRKPESAIQPSTTKSHNQSGLVWVVGMVDAVAAKLQTSGYKGESREAVMETFAKEARKVLAERVGNASATGSEQSPAPVMRASPVNARAGDIDFYNSGGKAVAYISADDNLTIYLWSGKPCAYLDDGDIYGFNGKHLGLMPFGNS